MADIFLSYAREDFEKASKLADLLTNTGWSVFWDHDILAGAIFDDVIQKQLDNARCVICLWSIHSTSSSFVRSEAEEGANRNMLVSVLIEDVRIPIAFRRIQAAKLLNWSGSKHDEQLKDVLRAVKYVVEKPPEPNSIGSPPADRPEVNEIRQTSEPQPRKFSHRRLAIVVGMFALGAVLVGTGYVFSHPTVDSKIASMLTGDPFIVELSGLSQNIGTILPKLWQASGPHRDFGYKTFPDDQSMDACDPHGNRFCIWGASFRFDKQGKVFFVAGGDVQQDAFKNESIGKIRLLKEYVAEGKPFAVVLDELSKHIGLLAPKGRYQMNYSPAELAWVGTGPVWDQERYQNAGSPQGPNCRPLDLSFCIWSVPFRLDQTNDVLLNSKDEPTKTAVGHIEW